MKLKKIQKEKISKACFVLLGLIWLINVVALGFAMNNINEYTNLSATKIQQWFVLSEILYFIISIIQIAISIIFLKIKHFFYFVSMVFAQNVLLFCTGILSGACYQFIFLQADSFAFAPFVIISIILLFTPFESDFIYKCITKRT